MELAVLKSQYEKIDKEIEELASRHIGLEVNLLSIDKLNHREKVHACRVRCGDVAGAEYTFIAKFLNESEIDPEADRFLLANFEEEIRNYRFLMELREEYPYFPALYGYNARVFLLEDLGTTQYEFEQNEDLLEAIAECFVNLHVVTHRKRQFYEEFVPSLAAVEDKRVFSNEMQDKIFRMGRDIVADYLSILTPHTAETFTQLTEPILDHLHNPGIFEAFIHDDLADGRQSVIKDGEIYLLDFEHGKFGHALMDLATLMVGKMERDTSIDKLTYYSILLPTKMFEVYRAKFEQRMQVKIDDAEWDRHIASCLIFHAFIVIKLCKYNSHKEFADSLAQTIKMILARLKKCMEGNTAYLELRQMLEQLAARIL